ncbi:ctr copper transporter [Meira miltonrushii]|uniref:Copper transport protein n=1 Tax=Meira miltonrushii TaxID=1280837 RepID=A0A316V2Q3_9BASI|nr:ctr copper transporter [Meira miltonrushii]PWN31534.1 ctr copper transporter [Meira miltonrushii]
MDGMNMEGEGSNACKISMLWNWYTIDACFLAEGWHIRNRGMFAATCIGVALMTVCLEALRRAGREYDVLIAKQWQAHARTITKRMSLDNNAVESPAQSLTNFKSQYPSSIAFRATPLQQLIRAVLHAATFGLAYILMLLVMYFNGYIIISIILGAGLGKFVCDWMSATIPIGAKDEQIIHHSTTDDPAVCC